RSAASASRARVNSFSFTSSFRCAASHCFGDTIRGVFVVTCPLRCCGALSLFLSMFVSLLRFFLSFRRCFPDLDFVAFVLMISFLRLFNELLEFGANDCGPAGFEILPRIRRRFRESFDSRVRQLHSCVVVLVEQFKRYQRIAWLSFVTPGIGDFLLRNYLSDPAKMMVSHAFVLHNEFKLKSDFRFEFL